ncbi:MAG: hypothetical protein IJM97_05250, partial [Clostridia bacterium]|nr:hypothetical protein [Clostridia bacterium]
MSKKIIALTILIAVFMSLIGCSYEGILEYSVSTENTEIITPESKDVSVHTTSEINAEKIAQDGFLSLWFDKKSCSVYVEDTSMNNKWYSLPNNVERENGKDAAVVNLKVVDKDKVYKLNSQDSSTTDYKKTKDGITVGYRMKADKTEYKITLTYKLEDGSLIVEADNERLSGDAVIESMDILSYMGATVNAKEGDYMILPDGCGAVVDTWNYSSEISSLSFAVYGNDSTVEATKSEYSSIAGVYGAKEGAKAFGAVITKGDAISTIKFDKATDKNKYNTVYPEFAITPTLRTQDKVYLSENSYDDSIRIVYRFLSGNIADYSGVATACREVLIREGFLSSAA